MRRIYFASFLILLCTLVTAQQPTYPPSKYVLEGKKAPSTTHLRQNTPVPMAPLTTSGCSPTDAMGTASNIFTLILNEANPLTVSNELNTIIFVHRNDASVFGGHSGQLRYDISTNGGASWTLNQGLLNPTAVNGTNAARYPSVNIYNPPANTNPNNAYLSYIGPTVAATWNGVVSGVRRLNGTGNTENYNQAGATQTLIPRSMVKGIPGVYWSIDAVWNGTVINGFRVHKGTWNGGTNDVVWSVNNTITPTFNTLFDGSPKVADFQIAFDPSGATGWICIQTHVTPGPSDFSFFPVFYQSVDSGATWTGPITVDLGQYPCITSNIQTGNFATTAFDLDLTVDMHGNPHAIMPIANGNNSYALFFTQWHAMYDITLLDGVWNPIFLREVSRGRGTWGVAPNTVTLDMESQASRTDDGSKVFFTWCDADSTLAQAVQDTSPNLFSMAYDVQTRRWTTRKDFTGCHPTWDGLIMFPKLSENVLGTSGLYRLPAVFARLNGTGSTLDPASFHYLDSLCYTDAEFTAPQCGAVVSIAATDTITVCGSTTLDAGSAPNVYAWSTGATTQTISVTQTGLYSVGVSSNCCTGADTVYVIVNQPASSAFGSSMSNLTGNFTDMSTGNITNWLWDFGDGNTSTLQSPSHTYASPGSYTVCLTVTSSCGSDSSCAVVTATCPPATAAFNFTTNSLSASFTDQTVGNVISWSWAFGDGNVSSMQNPTHNYAIAGSYTVCLAITDSCGSDTTCQVISVCTPVTPFFQWFQPGQSGMVTFTDGTNPAPLAWSWDFGDGNSSTQQNPTHTYTASGTYVVCLTTTDSCSMETFCDTINVTLIGLEAGLGAALQLWPNPAGEALTLRLESLAAGAVRLRVLNPLGQAVVAREVAHDGGPFRQQLLLDGLSEGMYFVEVETATGRAVRKFLKE